MAHMKKKSSKKTVSVRVGDKVRVTVGSRTVMAEIIEDRGRIGVRGKRLFRVRMNTALETEVPADELTPAHA